VEKYPDIREFSSLFGVRPADLRYPAHAMGRRGRDNGGVLLGLCREVYPSIYGYPRHRGISIMREYITLLGAEDVRRGGAAMASAAAEMRRAANSIETSLHAHRIFLDDWLGRLEQTIRSANLPENRISRRGGYIPARLRTFMARAWQSARRRPKKRGDQ
jgi:hypothetical protein